MTELLVHTATRGQLDNFAAAPSHAVLLVGPAGSGKKTLAAQLAETMLELSPRSLAEYPYKTIIKPEETGKAIGIQSIRSLEHFLGLKVPRQAAIRRAVIVQDAELLTVEAQNAFLKTLEEPPADTIIILAVSSEQALLPTIRSRAQAIHVKRPEPALTQAYFQALAHDDQSIKQAFSISGGLVGLMSSLLNQTDHPLIRATEYARQLLSQPLYERLLAVDQLAKDRKLALDTIFIIQQMALISIKTSSGAAAQKWNNIFVAGYEASEAMSVNAQPKLVLTRLMTSFSGVI